MDTYIARQPVFDKRLFVFGYELLYRSGSGNYFDARDADQATSELISNTMFLFGLEKLTRGRRAFINFTAKLLESEVIAMLPPDKVVVEVPRHVEPGESLLNACKRIKSEGFLLALDDFAYFDKNDILLELIDIIKVDFLEIRGDKRKEIMDRINLPGISYLAQKVESRDDFEEAVRMGYTYFQGFFFSKPVIITGQNIRTFKRTYLYILQEINRPDIDFDQVEELIKIDLALSYKLLRFINSAAFHFRVEISSIKQALTLLGQRELNKWFSMITIKEIGEDKPEELMVTAVCRARFCELLAPRVGLKSRSSDLFLLGLFSLIDVFLDQPLSAVLKELPLARDVKEALTGKEGPMGDVYKMVLSYERNEMETVFFQAQKLNLTGKELTGYYLEAVELGNHIFS